IEYLHRAGTARGDGLDVRGLPRPGRPSPDRAARTPDGDSARRRAGRGRRRRPARRILRYRHCGRRRAGGGGRRAPARRPPPLGSCTMKLNATAEMEPVTWPEFAGLHPFAPAEDAAGLLSVVSDLTGWLARITGYDAVSLQPNAGSQGEFAGLLAIRAYHRSRGDAHRNICLIPSSAHGTNAASAAMAGMRVVVVECDDAGNVDVDDLKRRAVERARDL